MAFAHRGEASFYGDKFAELFELLLSIIHCCPRMLIPALREGWNELGAHSRTRKGKTARAAVFRILPRAVGNKKSVPFPTRSSRQTRLTNVLKL